MPDPLYLHETDEPEVYLSRKNVSTGADEPAEGLTTLTVTYSATEEGSAIHSTLTQTMTERTRSPGVYYASILGTDKAAHLSVGDTVYRRIHDGPVNIDTAHQLVVHEVRTI